MKGRVDRMLSNESGGCAFPQCQSHTDVLRRIEVMENKIDIINNRLSECMMIDEGVKNEIKALRGNFKDTKAELLAVITEQNKNMIQQSSKYIEDFSSRATVSMQIISDQATRNASRMWRLVLLLSLLLAAAMGWDVFDKSGAIKLLGG